jgi:hypothetical protein
MKQNHATRVAAQFALGCLMLLILAGAAQAQALIHKNIEALVREAETILVGTCVSANEGIDTSYDIGPLGYVEYVFSVEEWVKGGVAGSYTKVIRQPRPLADGPFAGLASFQNLAISASFAQTPSYTPGQRYTLFLYTANEWGLTAPVGSIQGVFTFTKDAEGESCLVNGINNLGLFQNVDITRSDAHMNSMASAQARTLESNHPVRVASLLSTARSLMNSDINR